MRRRGWKSVGCRRAGAIARLSDVVDDVVVMRRAFAGIPFLAVRSGDFWWQRKRVLARRVSRCV